MMETEPHDENYTPLYGGCSEFFMNCLGCLGMIAFVALFLLLMIFSGCTPDSLM
jgi:hypothetical protein